MMPGKFYATEHGFGAIHVVPTHTAFQARCGGCGAQRPVDRKAIENAAGEHCELDDAELKLRCNDCGHKGGKILTGYYGEEDIP